MTDAVAMMLPNHNAGIVSPSTVSFELSKVTLAPAWRTIEEKMTVPARRPAVTSEFFQIEV